jgi:hypothetical protein
VTFLARCAEPRTGDVARMANKTPAPRALAAVKAGPPTEPIDKQLRITAKVRKAIDHMARGECKTIVEAAEKVGLCRESLSRALRKPHVVEFMRQRAIHTIQMAAGRAAEVKAELLDCGDSMARDRASSFVLGTAGIGPATAPSLSVNLEMRAGYVIMLDADPPRAPEPREVFPVRRDLDIIAP